jgi:hypothetical protein
MLPQLRVIHIHSAGQNVFPCKCFLLYAISHVYIIEYIIFFFNFDIQLHYTFLWLSHSYYLFVFCYHTLILINVTSC